MHCSCSNCLGKYFLPPHPPTDITSETFFGALFQFLERRVETADVTWKDIIQRTVDESDADVCSPMTRNRLHAPNTNKSYLISSVSTSCSSSSHSDEGRYRCSSELTFAVTACPWCACSSQWVVGVSGRRVCFRETVTVGHTCCRCHLQLANNPNTDSWTGW